MIDNKKVVKVTIDRHEYEFMSCDDALEIIDAYELLICPYCQGTYNERFNTFVHGEPRCH